MGMFSHDNDGYGCPDCARYQQEIANLKEQLELLGHPVNEDQARWDRSKHED